MGVSDSKFSGSELTEKLLSDSERARLKITWQKYGRSSMGFHDFYREIFHESIPLNTATALFDVFAKQSSAITAEQLFVGLAILTNADKDTRNAWFCQAEGCYTDVIPEQWIEQPPLLTDPHATAPCDYYEILSGVTHLTEEEVESLEQVWHSIRDAKTCKLSREQFKALVSPPVSDQLLDGYFGAFDENGDGQIDFKEFVCGLSASCRGPTVERLKFIYKMFDQEESLFVADLQLEINRLFEAGHLHEPIDINFTNADEPISMSSFLTWSTETGAMDVLLDIMSEVGHLCLGLRPINIADEQNLIRSFTCRVQLSEYSHWMLLPASWWTELMGAKKRSDVMVIDTRPLCIQHTEHLWQKLPSETAEGGFLRTDICVDADYKVVITDPITKDLLLELYPVTMVILKHEPATTSKDMGTSSLSSAATHTYGWMRDTMRQTVFGQGALYKRAAHFTCTFSLVANVEQLFTFLCQKHRLNQEATRLWLLVPNNEFSDTQHRADKNMADMLLLEDSTLTLAELNITSGSQILLEIRNADLTWPEEVLRLKTRDHYNLHLGQQASEKGVTGLNNLGNTCYMNSAIQCLSNTPHLTTYFLSGDYAKHLNRTSALSCKGEMATEYALLITQLWSGNMKVIAPLKLQATVRKFSDLFGDRAQHDCQEFLAFLLDSLHEDVNRAQRPSKCPQLKDSDGRNDRTVALEAWQHHQQFNDSVIVDLFAAQLKSTVTCSKCASTSARFDPYMWLSVPLPLDDMVLICVAGHENGYYTIAKLTGELAVRYGVRLQGEQRVKDLMHELSARTGIEATCLVLFQLNINGTFIREPAANECLKTLSIRDTIWYCYEVPPSAFDSDSNATVSTANTSFGVGVTDTVVCNGHVVVEEMDGDKCSANAVPATALHTHSYAVAVHRKMEYNTEYYLAYTQCRPVVFGCPLVIPLDRDDPSLTGAVLYERVWQRTQRLVDAPVLRHSKTINRALEPDDYNSYPFVLRVVDESYTACGKCAWHRLCAGCVLPLNNSPLVLHTIDGNTTNTRPFTLAVDWDAAALHLRFQHSALMACIDDESVSESTTAQFARTSLTSCLQQFTRTEHLDGTDTVHCNTCDTKQTATLDVKIYTLPQYLVIHLKRFVHVYGRWIKSSKVIDFELSGLDLSEFVDNESESENYLYDCYAMANQYGALSAGHYVAYAKHEQSGKWYLYNDSRCKEVSVDEIDRGSAYILFYKRADNHKQQISTRL